MECCCFFGFFVYLSIWINYDFFCCIKLSLSRVCVWVITAQCKASACGAFSVVACCITTLWWEMIQFFERKLELAVYVRKIRCKMLEKKETTLLYGECMWKTEMATYFTRTHTRSKGIRELFNAELGLWLVLINVS